MKHPFGLADRPNRRKESCGFQFLQLSVVYTIDLSRLELSLCKVNALLFFGSTHCTPVSQDILTLRHYIVVKILSRET